MEYIKRYSSHLWLLHVNCYTGSSGRCLQRATSGRTTHSLFIWPLLVAGYVWAYNTQPVHLASPCSGLRLAVQHTACSSSLFLQRAMSGRTTHSLFIWPLLAAGYVWAYNTQPVHLASPCSGLRLGVQHTACSSGLSL